MWTNSNGKTQTRANSSNLPSHSNSLPVPRIKDNNNDYKNNKCVSMALLHSLVIVVDIIFV